MTTNAADLLQEISMSHEPPNCPECGAYKNPTRLGFMCGSVLQQHGEMATTADCLHRRERNRAVASQNTKEQTALNPYLRSIKITNGHDKGKTVQFDIYDFLKAWDVSGPREHAIKKLLRCGREGKSAQQDLAEAMRSIQRALEQIEA